MLYEFFKNLADRRTDEDLDFRFVLALLLVRRKVLKFDRMEERNGGMFLLFRHLKDKTEYPVSDRDLTEEQIGEVNQKVEGFLEVKLE